MITGIDHVVILVRDLATAMDDYGRLGFTVELGGEHPGGTHNALIAFEDGAYLELIAFQRPDEPHEHPWHEALRYGEGLVAFAVGSSDLAGDAERLRGRGLRVDGPQDGARTRPDGRRLEWLTAGIGSGPRGRQRPFVIEDVTERAWRVASGRLARHANGVVGVVDVTLTVAELGDAMSELALLLGEGAPPIEEVEDGRWVRFATPRGAIVLLEPTAGGEVATATAERGDHLSGVTLATMPQGGEPAFDPARAHGAAISLQPT